VARDGHDERRGSLLGFVGKTAAADLEKRVICLADWR